MGANFCGKLTQGQGMSGVQKPTEPWTGRRKGWDQVRTIYRIPVREGSDPGDAELTNQLEVGSGSIHHQVGSKSG